jgi:transcriptional regulator with XRE-family HTH domain
MMDGSEFPPSGTNSQGRASFGTLLRSLRKRQQLRQLDLAERAFMDHTVVSRIETGAFVPDRAMLGNLLSALNLSAADRQWLEIVYGRTILSSRGVQSVAVVAIDALTQMALKARSLSVELRNKGDSGLAAQVAHDGGERLRQAICGLTDEVACDHLMAQFAELAYFEAKCYLDIVPERAIPSIVLPAYQDYRSAACSLPVARRATLGGILAEGILYFGKYYDEADRVSKSLMASNVIDASWQPEVIRAAIINAGHLGDGVALQRHERTMRRVFDETPDWLDRVFLLEGLARAHAQLGKSRAVDELQQAWEMLEEIQRGGIYSSLRHVQVARTHLKANEQLGRRNEPDLERRAEESVLICRRYGYDRYEEEVEKLLVRAK